MQDNHCAIADNSPSSSAGRPRSGSARTHMSHGSDQAPDIDVHDYARQPSIRIRRLSSVLPAGEHWNAPLNGYTNGQNGQNGYNTNTTQVGRSRGNSAPQRFDVPDITTPRLNTQGNVEHMPELAEEIISPTTGNVSVTIPAVINEGHTNQNTALPSQPSSGRRLRKAKTNIANIYNDDEDYEAGLVDILDVLDPEVSTLSTLTNLQNSLFVPDLGKYLNRRPTYTLTRRPAGRSTDNTTTPEESDEETKKQRPTIPDRATTGATLNTLSSNINQKYYAVLPHGVQLRGWTEEEKMELNDHVRHMLHSKRSRFKRSMKGFGQYVKRPLGFFVTVYATLITLFGLAWVLFLIGWINVGGKRDYIVNVIDNIMVALFAIMGDGLAPFRCVDTYHMCFIAHYHHLTWRLRKEKALPKLEDHNDLPSIQPEDIEEYQQFEDELEYSVLTPEQQRKLAHHQKKFARSHSFYKPHEAMTHHAFPLRLLVAIVVLLDCHSLLQITLGTCTWAISYHVRPFALTTVVLCCSITVNITAGILISVGDHKTRKKDVLEKMLRQELTEEAMKKVEKNREKEESSRYNLGGVLQDAIGEADTDPTITRPMMATSAEIHPLSSMNSMNYGGRPVEEDGAPEIKIER